MANRILRASAIAALIGMAMVGAPMTSWAGDPINTGHFGNVAIQGYDPVAYFTEKRAVKGNEVHSHKWLGAEWRFSSAEHKRLFAESPQSYAPQYGGHCATGLAIHGGLTKDIDPEAWAIIDDKLYLNYSKETNSLLTGNIVSLEKSEKNWNKQLQSGTH
jgi:YHS domain-containing protein